MSKPELKQIPPMLPRYLIQSGFLLFYGWLGWRFYQWVTPMRQGLLPGFERPTAVDAFLPISGLAGLRHWIGSGELLPIHPAAVLIFVMALLTALLLKRGFCSWFCPVFPISEILWRLGAKVCGRNFAPPRWLDLILRTPKYILLGFFLYQILLVMPLPGLRAFLLSPYHKTADVRMLDFFLQPSTTTLLICALLAVASFFVQMAWCRYLCPYGALLGILSLLSPTKISRNKKTCTDCGLCAAHCPAWLPVDQRAVVRSPECYACYRCVQNCPSAKTLRMKFLRRYSIPAIVFGALLLLIVSGVWSYGKATNQWESSTTTVEIRRILLFGR